MKINESNLLKAGFSKSEVTGSILAKIQNSTHRVLSVFSNQCYKISTVSYDYSLGGEIPQNIFCVQYKGKYGRLSWFLVFSGEVYDVNTMEEVLEVDNSLSIDRSLGFCYVIKSKYGYKIGYSNQIHNRTKLFSVKLPFEFEIVQYYMLSDYKKMETMAHDLFFEKWVNGEWFDLQKSDFQMLSHLHKCLYSPS